MQIQELAMDESVEFVKDSEEVKRRFENILKIISVGSSDHLPLMAYEAVIRANIKRIEENKMFYFPIPWDKKTGLPSHPSLVADAMSYCRTKKLDSAEIIVSSFSQWSLLCNQKIFCCCGRGSISSRERIVSIDIVIHHPFIVDYNFGVVEIKQLIGIRSNDRDHIEKHYDLRRDSRVNNDISIIGTSMVGLSIDNSKIFSGADYARQFDTPLFKKIFGKMCESLV